MDQAWALEQTFWEESSNGRAVDFYARHMTSDGFVVLPSRVVNRYELIADWGRKGPITSYELSEPTYTLVEGGNVVITYDVKLSADWLPEYAATMTVLYTWGVSEWSLVFRAHTPRGAFPF